ncbi:PH domain-containing protein [Candidatus Pacearchaeota archaeon]|nr:PH domain-containing protein [Candidatus Pacearchaeota archaeon]
MNKLHPATKWLFRISGYFGSIVLVIILTYALLVPAGLFLSFRSGDNLSVYITIVAIGMLALIIIFGEIYAQLAYANWGYEFTPRELKIERGIIWKRYSNVPYERVQNVDITRGIIARIFGFSTVNIQTAGYSGYHKGGGTLAEGYIPGVDIDTAERIREFVLNNISGKHPNKSGL